MKIIRTYTMVEIGRSYQDARLGEIKLSDGRGELSIVGLSSDELRELGSMFAKPVTVTIEVAPATGVSS